MAGLFVYTGNRMEVLADHLARLVNEPLASPLSAEIVVVQSRGMARWLSMRLARRLGVWANCAYPFPNTFVQALFSRILPDMPTASPYEPEALAFRIMGLLPECAPAPGYGMLRRYIENDPDGLKRYQLARRIADTFDQYLLFRPDMMLRWEEGEAARDPDEAWQADLWRRIVGSCGGLHRARLMRRFLRAIDPRRPPPAGLPERISVFGISYLPRFHLQVLHAVSRLVPVHFFLMSPCREYWGDILTAREIRDIRSTYGEGGDEEALLLESGHPLLASMGRMGRDFFSLICGLDAELADFSEAPAGSTLLGAVQADILDLRDRTAGPVGGTGDPGRQASAGAAPSGDGSLQIHCCHSPMREIEVLYDQLLAMFAADPKLTPEDIGVMTPDIEAYAPFLQAVFGSPSEGAARIPFSIADRSIRRQNRTADAFLSILDFKQSRFTAGEVVTLLETPAIQACFHLDDRDLETVLKWVRETRIRWGRDGASRQELGLPPYAENTWQAGLDRLLLGYAMPGEGRAMFGGVLPYDDVGGQDWMPLEKLLVFLDTLFDTAGGLREERTLSGWCSYLSGALERFFLADASTEPALQAIRSALDDLAGCQQRAGFDSRIALEPVRAYLAERLELASGGQGFLSGGVTFCALLPMRSIPFKVICLIGMNDASFPRDSRTIGFDLMARYPRPGDRSRRADDKYLFLEALVSARRRLYISYVGKSVQDNSPIPPCVLVSELLDYLRAAYGHSDRDLVVQHLLQAFSPVYFSGQDRLFSYSRENLEAAAGLTAPAAQAPPAFISRGLPPPQDEWRRLDLDTLKRFFRNPSRFILRERLGIDLEGGPFVADEREHFELDGLERFQLSQELVEAALAGMDTRDFLAFHRAAGRLPPGAPGEAVFDRLRADTAEFVDRVQNLLKADGAEARWVEIEIAGFFLSGRLEGITPTGLIQFHPAKDTGVRQLLCWIDHLICSSRPDPDMPAPRPAYLVSRDRTWVFQPPRDSRHTLAALLQRCWEGLSRPLAFFPESSLAYAEQTLLRGRPREAALKSARARWGPTDFGDFCECENPYFDLCFGVSQGAPAPLEEAVFADLAEEIYGPMLACRRELRASVDIADDASPLPAI